MSLSPGKHRDARLIVADPRSSPSSQESTDRCAYFGQQAQASKVDYLDINFEENGYCFD